MPLAHSTLQRPAQLTAAALVLLLAACGTETDEPADPPSSSDTAPSSSPTAPATTPTEDPDAALPPFPQGTAPQVDRGPGGTALVLTDVRVGQQQGFDRIVLEFSGAGTPGWSTNYVDRPRRDGSGQVVALEGDTVLDIYASGTTAPAPDYYDGPRRLQSSGVTVREVYVSGTFEGDTQVLAGIEGDPAPFRVFALSEPARLVVDVAADD